jgi:hypothetical protein
VNAEQPPPLTEKEARDLLRSLAGVDVILVGGQAINVWATRYLARAAELESEGPFTSKDVDLWGDRKAVRECARRNRILQVRRIGVPLSEENKVGRQQTKPRPPGRHRLGARPMRLVRTLKRW